MNHKTLCLTPECSKLWAVRPGIGFLYDDIIMDRRDYEGILASRDDCTFKFFVARNVEQFKMEGILRVEDFSKILKPKFRKRIHDSATSFVSNLPEQKQLELTISSHKDYRDYVKSQILFTAHDEPKYSCLVERLTSVEDRLRTLKTKPQMNEVLAEALGRITAKSLAGSYVTSYFDGAHLFDTSEYRPFINAMSIDSALFHDEVENTALDIIAAIILNKPLPDITVYDDHTMTEFLRTRESRKILRDALREIVERYHDLIQADPLTAKEHLLNSFQESQAVMQMHLKEVAKQKGLLWKIMEILGSIKSLPLVSLLDSLEDRNLETYGKQEIDSLRNEDELLANLICVFDCVKQGERIGLKLKRKWREPDEDETKIWGEDGSYLPWYERESG